MKTKREQLPRLSNSLRTFSGVGATHDFQEAEHPKLLEFKRKSKAERSARKNYPQWKNIKNIFDKECSVPNEEVKAALRDLLQLAKEIVGSDSSQEMIEGTAAYLFKLCHNSEIMSEKQSFQLRVMFGVFKSSIARKICKLTNKMYSWLYEGSQNRLFEENKDDLNSLMDKEFGYKTKFTEFRTLRNEDILLDVNDFKNDNNNKGLNFSLEYLENSERNKITQMEPIKVPQYKRCDASWLEKTIRQCYGGTTNNPLQLPINDIVQFIMSLLNSSRTNDELQNDLFDYLGYDNFNLIEMLLQKRHEITTSRANEPVELSLTSQTTKEQRPNYGCQVTIQSEEEVLLKKQLRKEERKIQKDEAKTKSDGTDNFQFDPVNLRKQREFELLMQTHTPLLKRPNTSEREKLPYVFDSYSESKSTAAYISSNKMTLPVGHVQIDNQTYHEIRIPASGRPPEDMSNLLVSIDALDEIGKIGFQGMKTLNLVQSVVFNTAYNTNENLLICAPTGAGKTNIAMLTVLHEVKKHMENGVLRNRNFKIIYIAPMKALAAEMVRNFSKRLEPLGVNVKELTGDTQLTKKEILQTQMIVTTPEKWDVVTRKSTGDTALSLLVRLIILDEVHLLHGDRGPVLEAIVARTLRQVESSQSMIRLVGLSATVPNYLDVANFLCVNVYKGLFYFDGRFRPVPLGQTFIGVKDVNPLLQMKSMDEVCYKKVCDTLSDGHQVMVFVHARNATVRTAMAMKNMATEKNHLHLFQCMQSIQYFAAEKQISKSRNKQLRELFPNGFAIHHAGMLRIDRSLVERLFCDGLIKVLVCTSTLAWGVNLPAHSVIIRGTEIYDSKHGQFVDLDILDVMQIFGRAGRPQYDAYGEGTIITSHDKLHHYLSLLTSQLPIESNFINNLADNLNAEISLGTVTNIEEALTWLSYTYLLIRVKCNPQIYGLRYYAEKTDPGLTCYQTELIEKAAMKLDETKMIRFDQKSGNFFPTDVGRIASHFYIKYDTVSLFNEVSTAMTEREILSLITRAEEFHQLKVRDDELDELDKLRANSCWIDAIGGSENTHGKINILIQAYISQSRIEGFSLISDQAYIIQNATRIVRSLFEIVLKNNSAIMSGRLLQFCKCIEKQMWEFLSPLHQFSELGYEILNKIEQKYLTADKIKDMTAQEVGHMIHHVKMGGIVKQCVDSIPYVIIDASIQPVTRTIVKVKIDLTPSFRWNDRYHGTNEPFWIWIADPESDRIYHSEYFILTKKQVIRRETQSLVTTIPIVEPLPAQYMVNVISDRWLGAEYVYPISFKHLLLPDDHPPHTELLDLQPLPITALNSMDFESIFRFQHFNPIQTQLFHTLYHTDSNVLLGAPTGSGKTIAAEIAIFRVFHTYPGTKVVYIAPLKALVRERIKDWKIRFEEKLHKSVVELTGDVTPDARAIASADIIVTTPEKWDGVSRSWQTRQYVKAVSLIVIDEIHLLGEDRGPVLEVIVSRTNFISANTGRKLRIIGLSTALANARDLGDWLGIKELGLYNFRPSVRPVPLEVHVSGYPGKHYCPRMALMNKPAYQAICTYSPEKPVLIFVSSRRQTRLTALDLIAFLAAESNPRRWIEKVSEQEMELILQNVRDQNLKLTLAFGIGLHHAGLHERDRNIVEELFANGKIQVLIATATLAWGVNFPAHLVIVKGTEYYDGKTQRYVDFPITDVLQMIGRAGRPQFDDHGIAVVLVHDVKKGFYKKFLYEPFPVESSLLKVLPDHLNAEIVAGTITSKQECIDYLTWTYFFRRLLKNPTYYGLENIDHSIINKFLSGLVDRSLRELELACCVEIAEDNRTVSSTVLGRICSFYYLSYKTIHMFHEKMGSGMSPEQLLKIVTDAEEYAELPVRHNEDALNSDLAKSCPIEVDKYTFDSPHTKAHLLFQSHFSRLVLPCSDYLTDLKSVLDQAIRILQAIIDIASDQGWLSTSIQAMILLQMVLQGRWHNDSTLLTLPHIDNMNLFCFSKVGQSEKQNRTCNGPIEYLPELMIYVKGQYEVLAGILRRELEENHIEHIYETLTKLPIISTTIILKGCVENADNRFTTTIPCEDFIGKRPASHWIRVNADQEYVLRVGLVRENRRNKDETKAIAPKFPKQKDEGWFLVLGDIEKQELIAMKRIGFVASQAYHELVFYSPETHGRHIYTLFIISDCYLGLDQQYDICLNAVDSSKTSNETNR